VIVVLALRWVFSSATASKISRSDLLVSLARACCSVGVFFSFYLSPRVALVNFGSFEPILYIEAEKPHKQL
jgi:hypothetical protein